MTDEQIALACRTVACKGWRWMPGMLTTDGFRICRVDDDGYKFGYLTEYSYAHTVDGDVLPDLEDPATRGCLLALVREAWDGPRALVRLSANGKSFHVFDVDRVTTGGNWAAWLCGDRILQTEAEALVAALEAAP